MSLQPSPSLLPRKVSGERRPTAMDRAARAGWIDRGALVAAAFAFAADERLADRDRRLLAPPDVAAVLIACCVSRRTYLHTRLAPCTCTLHAPAGDYWDRVAWSPPGPAAWPAIGACFWGGCVVHHFAPRDVVGMVRRYPWLLDHATFPSPVAAPNRASILVNVLRTWQLSGTHAVSTIVETASRLRRQLFLPLNAADNSGGSGAALGGSLSGYPLSATSSDPHGLAVVALLHAAPAAPIADELLVWLLQETTFGELALPRNYRSASIPSGVSVEGTRQYLTQLKMDFERRPQ